MILKNKICQFSGKKITPGRGIVFIRNDGQLLFFSNCKSKKLYHSQRRPSKIGWTMAYRKIHKKDQVYEITRKHKNSKIKSYPILSSQVTNRYSGNSVDLIYEKL